MALNNAYNYSFAAIEQLTPRVYEMPRAAFVLFSCIKFAYRGKALYSE